MDALMALPNCNDAGCAGARCDAIAIPAVCADVCESQRGHKCSKEEVAQTLVGYLCQTTGKWCTCMCSCVGHDTLIWVNSSANGYEPLEDIEVGDSVLTLDQATGKWEAAPVIFVSDFGEDNSTAPRQEVAVHLFIDTNPPSLLVTTPGHILLLPNQSLARADCLSPNDQIVLADGLTSVVVTDVDIGEFIGRIQYLTANSWNIENVDHLISTGGVVSADYTLQESLSTVFTPCYNKLNQLAYKKFAATYKAPADAVSFFPEGFNTRVADTHLNELLFQAGNQMAHHAIWRLKRHTPNIDATVHWFSPLVDALAFKKGDTVHVELHGGLLRHNLLTWEAFELILSHVVARVSGKTHLSLEEADKASTKLVRRSWWGDTGFSRAHQGAQDLLHLLQSLDEAQSSSECDANGVCSHQTPKFGPRNLQRVSNILESLVHKPATA